MRAIRGGRIAMIFQEPMTALNPLMKGRSQIEVLEIHTSMTPQQRRERVLELIRDVHFAGTRTHDRELSASALRRATPARGHCDGPGARTRPDYCRRADDGPLIHHAGADPAPDQGAPPLTGQRSCSSHTRFRRGGQIADRVAVMRHVRYCRTGPRRAGPRRAAGRLYTKALVAAVPGLKPRRQELGPTQTCFCASLIWRKPIGHPQDFSAAAFVKCTQPRNQS